MTYKPQNIINDCIAWDQAKRKAAEEIPAEEINQKVSEVFTDDTLNRIKENTNKALDNLFKDLF